MKEGAVREWRREHGETESGEADRGQVLLGLKFTVRFSEIIVNVMGTIGVVTSDLFHVYKDDLTYHGER